MEIVENREKSEVRVKKKTLMAVVEECQRALESLNDDDDDSNDGEEGNSWDIVADNDLWESGNGEDDQEDFVVVRQEDIVDGIACFMAAYLLSLKETKDLAPKQLQDGFTRILHFLELRQQPSGLHVASYRGFSREMEVAQVVCFSMYNLTSCRKQLHSFV
ncbi:hypothetical protein KSS87_013183 [Heliosperma pusillum]|nr:hypothetical protein KSS87_013183 [Heliosperma pusillum]